MRYFDEIGRKTIHLSSAMFPLSYWFLPFLSKERMLLILGSLVIFTIVVETLRHTIPGVKSFFQRWLGNITRDFETATLTGASYVVFGAFLSVWLFPKEIAITVLLFVSVSDALASLVGIKFGGQWRLFGKSAAGSGAFLISAIAIVFLTLPDALAAGLIGALVATIVEALPIGLAGRKFDDNLTVSLSGGAVILLLQTAGL